MSFSPLSFMHPMGFSFNLLGSLPFVLSAVYSTSLVNSGLLFSATGSQVAHVKPLSLWSGLGGVVGVYGSPVSAVYSLPSAQGTRMWSALTCAPEWVSIMIRSVTLTVRYVVNLTIGICILDFLVGSIIGLSLVCMLELFVVVVQVSVVVMLFSSWIRP